MLKRERQTFPFRSILATMSITPTYMKAIDTAEDLLMSDLDFYCVDTAANFLSTSPTPNLQKLKDKIVIFNYPEVPDILERLS